MYTSLYLCILVCACVYICILCIPAYTCVCLGLLEYTNVDIRKYLFMPLYTSVYLCIHVCTCVYLCKHV